MFSPSKFRNPWTDWTEIPHEKDKAEQNIIRLTHSVPAKGSDISLFASYPGYKNIVKRSISDLANKIAL